MNNIFDVICFINVKLEFYFDVCGLEYFIIFVSIVWVGSVIIVLVVIVGVFFIVVVVSVRFIVVIRNWIIGVKFSDSWFFLIFVIIEFIFVVKMNIEIIFKEMLLYW